MRKLPLLSLIAFIGFFLAVVISLLTPLAEQQEPFPLPQADRIAITNAATPPQINVEEIFAIYQQKVIGHRVVYLIAENAVDDSFVVSPSKLQSDLGIEIANDWQAFIEIDRIAPVEAVIIHQSALPFVDYEWTAEAYRRGVYIVLVNILHPELDQILGIDCGKKPPETWYPGNFFITFTIVVRGVYEEDVQNVINAHSSCQDEDDVELRGGITIFTLSMNENLDIEHGYLSFVGALGSYFENLDSVGKFGEPIVEPVTGPFTFPDSID